MKKILLALMLLTGGSVFGQVSFGINIGPPPRPRVGIEIPLRPDPSYFWIDGYWYPFEGQYSWHDGYWSRPPYMGAQWIGPRHDGRQFFPGYWNGNRGRVEHDHHWDNEGGRDFNHGGRGNEGHGNEGHGEGHGHGRH